MTNPAPSPDAAQPPVPDRTMPRLGRGVHWPDIMAKLEAERRDTPAPAGALDDARRQLGITEEVISGPSSAVGEEPDLPLMAEPRVPQNRARVTRYRRPDALAEAEKIRADLREQIGDTPYLALALEAAAAPSRRARWRRALDRIRRSQP